MTGYVITADLDPENNHLKATAAVTLTAVEDLTSVAPLNSTTACTLPPSLNPITGQTLTSEPDSPERFHPRHIALNTPLFQRHIHHLHFHLRGHSEGRRDQPRRRH